MVIKICPEVWTVHSPPPSVIIVAIFVSFSVGL